MRKPVSEHSTTIKARKGEAPERQVHHEHMLEPVGGGSVRRVEFEEDRHPVFQEATIEREWRPRGRDSIDDIHFEVDNIHRLRRPAPRVRRQQSHESRRVFETPRGAVKESHMQTAEGERRVLYTSKRTGPHESDQRFHSGLVDRVIAQRYHGGPKFEQAEDEAPRRGWMRKQKEREAPKETAPTEVTPVMEEVVTKADKPKPAAKAKAPLATPKPKKTRAPVAKAPVAKATSAKKGPRKKPAVEPEGYRPQCEAVTAEGLQCRNSAKARSKFCGAHQGYKARRLEDVLDTHPAHDTKPGVGDPSGTGQCAAYTKDGMQCLNHSRTTSKYCAVHKGYRMPSKAELARRLDTAPRFAGAKDTKPRLRK